MKLGTPLASWIPDAGLRLHAGPYASGIVQLRRRLATFDAQPLGSLTTGPYGGIYTPPIHNFKRMYVSSLEHGVPFLGTTSMLHADFVGVPLLSRAQAESEKYRILRIREGMTLVSCSGTIGRTVYARRDMENMWSSGDILKILPGEGIDGGYLHAFISSTSGVAAMVADTYGSIVPHIEAGHVARLPVPRLGPEIEACIGRLIRDAADARSRARDCLSEAQKFLREMVLVEPSYAKAHSAGPVRASMLQQRFDAYYFSVKCSRARKSFDSPRCGKAVTIGDVASVFIPGIFKRRYARVAEHGYQYLTGADVFQIAPTSDRYLMREVAEDSRLLVGEGMILVQEAGQLGGLIGHSVLVGKHFGQSAVTNNMIRIRCNQEVDTAYLCALLSVDEGVTLIARESAGSSIPHIDADRIKRLAVPWATDAIREHVAAKVLTALHLREQACNFERQARVMVDKALEAVG